MLKPIKLNGVPAVLLSSLLITLAIINAGCSTAPDWSAEKDITRIPLDWALSNGKPTLADFGWRDCIPCKKMKPLLEQLAERRRGKLNILIVEVYNHPDLMDWYEIDAIPVQILFDYQGKEIIRHEGFWPEENILTELSRTGIK